MSEVKIYTTMAFRQENSDLSDNALWVSREDYESLQSALREALEQWSLWKLQSSRGAVIPGDDMDARISELRKLLES